jgi:hypothetical protein
VSDKSEEMPLAPDEIARRRDDAIRRALNTPKPKKPKGTNRNAGGRRPVKSKA